MFEAGQEVKYQGMRMPATIISGPHASPGNDRWLIRKADGNVSLVPFRDLSAVVTERERLAALAYSAANGRRMLWTEMPPGYQSKYLRIVDAILADKAGGAPERPPLAVGDYIRTLKSLFNPQTLGRIPAGSEVPVHALDGSYLRVVFRAQPMDLALTSEGASWERV